MSTQHADPLPVVPATVPATVPVATRPRTESSTHVPSDQARHMHQLGRTAAAERDYAAALRFYAEAHLLAPTWPAPPYDAAFVHLLRDEPREAETMYQRVDLIFPDGFFSTKSTLDCLRRERQELLPVGTAKALALLAWETDHRVRRTTLEAMVRTSPAFPQAWLALAKLIADPAEREAAIEKGLLADPDRETRGQLVVEKALALKESGRLQESIGLLQHLAGDEDATLSSRQQARLLQGALLHGETS